MSCTSEFNSVEDQHELGALERIERELLVCGERGLKSTDLNSLAPHRKTIAIPIDDADPIPPLREKDVEVPGERVCEKDTSNHRNQAVGALPSVDRLRRHENADARWQAQHALSSRTSLSNRRRASSSKDDGTRTASPPGST